MLLNPFSGEIAKDVLKTQGVSFADRSRAVAGLSSHS